MAILRLLNIETPFSDPKDIRNMNINDYIEHPKAIRTLPTYKYIFIKQETVVVSS